MPSRSTLQSGRPTDICARLTTNRDGNKEVLGLSLTRPILIGRNPDRCTYVIPDSCVSGIHCYFFAVRSPSGGVIVSCRDVSKNGIFLNGHRIRKTWVILMDGDTLRIPDSLTFTCIHDWKSSGQDSVFDPSHPVQKHIGRYILTSQCLGSGSFATVYLAWKPEKNSAVQVACKSIKKKKENDHKQVMKEIRILMSLQHPNINRILGTEENGEKSFFHIFLELCTGGDLFTYINSYSERNSRMRESEAKYIMYQLLKGLEYLHAMSISHRDLKPENILLYTPESYPRIQIADFGLARPKSYQETFNVCGTVSYLPPEGILALDQKHLGYVGMPSDCWSAGIILYIMLSGSHPFDNEVTSDNSWFDCVDDSQHGSHFSPSQPPLTSRSEVRLKEKIVIGEVDFQWPLWSGLPKAKDLISSLLIHDPNQRATVYIALQNSWIANDLGFLEDLYRSQIVASLTDEDKERCSSALLML